MSCSRKDRKSSSLQVNGLRMLQTFLVIGAAYSYTFPTSRHLSLQNEKLRSGLFRNLHNQEQTIRFERPKSSLMGFRERFRTVFTKREQREEFNEDKIITPDFLDNLDDPQPLQAHFNDHLDTIESIRNGNANQVRDENASGKACSEINNRRQSTQDFINRIRSGQLTKEEKEAYFYAALKSGNTVNSRKPAIVSSLGNYEERSTSQTENATLTTKAAHHRFSGILNQTKSRDEKNEITKQSRLSKIIESSPATINVGLGRRLGEAAFVEQQQKQELLQAMRNENLTKKIEEEKEDLIQKEKEMSKILSNGFWEYNMDDKRGFDVNDGSDVADSFYMESSTNFQRGVTYQQSQLEESRRKTAIITQPNLTSEKVEKSRFDVSEEHFYRKKLRPLVTLDGKLSFVEEHDTIPVKEIESSGDEVINSNISQRNAGQPKKKETIRMSIPSDDSFPVHNDEERREQSEATLMNRGENPNDRAKRWGIDMSKYN